MNFSYCLIWYTMSFPSISSNNILTRFYPRASPGELTGLRHSLFLLPTTLAVRERQMRELKMFNGWSLILFGEYNSGSIPELQS